MVLVKNWKLFERFFFEHFFFERFELKIKINGKKTIFDVLYRKEAFLNDENIGFKKPQN